MSRVYPHDGRSDGPKTGKNMRFPNESLEDYKARKLRPIDPPAPATLEFTGETELLKPLARWDGPVKRTVVAESFWRSIFSQLSWFHRSLAMSGALTIVTFLLGTGLYFTIYGPPVDTTQDVSQVIVGQDDIATGRDTGQLLLTENQQNAADSVPDETAPLGSDKTVTPRFVAKHKPSASRVGLAGSHPRVVVASYRPLRPWLHPLPWVSQFAPTTQVIFVENGVIKTRFESSGYKRPSTLPN